MMKTRAGFGCVCAAGVLAGVSAGSASAVVIDTFDDATLAPAIGATRQVTLTDVTLAVPGLDDASAQVVPSASLLDYESSVGASATLELRYFAAGQPGGLNLDLSAENAFEIDVLSFDLAAGAPIQIEVTVLDQLTQIALASGVIDTAGAQTVLVPFTQAVLDDPSLAASIDEMSFEFVAGAGADFRITEVRAVPEPASLALAGLGALALAGRRRA